jgi:soluble lytic murein transglycosylase-like protein
MLKRRECRAAASRAYLKSIILVAVVGAISTGIYAQGVPSRVERMQLLTAPHNLPSVQTRHTPEEIEAIIRASARKYGLPEEKVVHIAWRESKFTPEARSKSGRYVGIYQFDLTTWRNTPEGRAGLRREDPLANINAAHWHMKEYGFQAWAVGGSSRAHPRRNRSKSARLEH